MPWWNFVGDIFKGGKEVAEVFVENKEHKGQRYHEEKMADVNRDMASLHQFAAEFHARQKRSRWDSFVDGLNRLPRPLIAIAILSFFVLAPLDPIRFLEIAKAYELMPSGYWALLSIIIGFYFGGRMQIKSQNFAIKKNAVVAAKELIEMKKEFRKLEQEEEPLETKIFNNAIIEQGDNITNKVVAKWLESRQST